MASYISVGADNRVYVNVLRSLRPVGELVCMESGYYEFFPDLDRGGCWPTWMLRGIADAVDTKNAKWDAQVTKDVGVFDGKDD